MQLKRPKNAMRIYIIFRSLLGLSPLKSVSLTQLIVEFSFWEPKNRVDSLQAALLLTKEKRKAYKTPPFFTINAFPANSLLSDLQKIIM
jgi:hypothetical protein